MNDSVNKSVWDSVINSVDSDVYDSVCESVWDSVINSLSDSVYNKLKTYDF